MKMASIETNVSDRVIKETDVNHLSVNIRSKVWALLQLQCKSMEIETEYHRRLFELDSEFQVKREPIYTKRKAIINGEYVPTDEAYNIAVEASERNDEENIVSGIDNFWMEILKNCCPNGSFIHENDIPALKFLTDIQWQSKNVNSDLSFIIEFYFAENPYFENDILTKEYFLMIAIDAEDPFSFDGAEIYKCDGCQITWKNEMKIISNNNESFFDFFNPPKPSDKDDIDDWNDINDRLENDFEIGLFIKEKIIPRAVLYFLKDESDLESNSDNESSESTEETKEEIIINDTIY